MRAFLETINNEYLDDFVYMAKQPLLSLGVEVIQFDTVLHENMSALLKYKPTKGDIVIGSVDACEAFFKHVGIETPRYIGYPASLGKYLHRAIYALTLKEVVSPFPYFIKPKNKVKLFTGCLIENQQLFNTFKTVYNVSDDEELFLSSPVNFVSEYRCFVYKNKLQGLKHYIGDFKIFPNILTIESMIARYEEQNVAYTLDVGVLDTGETALIEVNDMWALGSYGFDSKIYVRMVIDRFQEIFKK